jgi:hypothetical protein
VTGLAIPVRAAQGRAVLESGERQLAKIISLALLDGDSDHPYGDDAGTDSPVFGLRTPALEALYRHRVEDHFARLEAGRRARLLSLDFPEAAAGELRVAVRYVDLETDREGEVVQTIRRA